MARIVIDARESGTSTGRYIDKLVENLYILRPKEEIIVLTKPHRVSYVEEAAPGFIVHPANYKEFSFAEQLGYGRFLRSLKPDLVHFGKDHQPVLYGGKVVTTMHDLTTARFRNPAKLWPVFKFKQLVYRWVVKRVARKSAAILTGSKFVKDDLVQFTHVPADKITVTYEAAEPILSSPVMVPELRGKPFIMYIGRPTPHKNLERLIEAFEKLSEEHPDLLLALAGKKDSNYRRIESKVRKKGLKNVVFTGFVGEGQLRWMYENCSAYVFPSLSEGFGLPGLEAMAHGAPVVSSDATCLPEIYGQAAHYFDPRDIGAMAAAIDRVLNDGALRQKLIAAGAERVKKYSWRRMAEQTLAVYQKALGSQS